MKKDKVCVMSTPNHRGINCLEGVYGELEKLNEYKNIQFLNEMTFSGSLTAQQLSGRYRRQKADQEYFKPFLQEIWLRWFMLYLCHEIKNNLEAALTYTLPSFKSTDHLRDCFGWLWYKRRSSYDEFCEAFCNQMEKSIPWLKNMRWRP